MKMKLTFLLLASVFFVSCGMPTIFAPSPSEYTLSSPATETLNAVQGKFALNLGSGPTYDLLIDPATKGPSLMFFYTFDNENELSYTLSSIEISSILQKFASEFVKNKYDGIPVNASKEILSVKFTDANDTSLEKNVYLYGLSPQGIGNHFNAANQYVLYAENQHNNVSLDPFTLGKTDLGSPVTEYSLKLTWTDFPATIFKSNVAPLNELYAYDGQPFSMIKTKIQDKIKDSNNHEYEYLGIKEVMADNPPPTIRLHLFVAFFISGEFSNNFWSNLIHLGAIPITLT